LERKEIIILRQNSIFLLHNNTPIRSFYSCHGSAIYTMYVPVKCIHIITRTDGSGITASAATGNVAVVSGSDGIPKSSTLSSNFRSASCRSTFALRRRGPETGTSVAPSSDDSEHDDSDSSRRRLAAPGSDDVTSGRLLPVPVASSSMRRVFLATSCAF